jgi:hypothetical protein
MYDTYHACCQHWRLHSYVLNLNQFIIYFVVYKMYYRLLEKRQNPLVLNPNQFIIYFMVYKIYYRLLEKRQNHLVPDKHAQGNTRNV